MKKLVLLLCALFLIQGVSAQVWIPMSTDLLNLESFRHQATYAIEDDLDNAIDGTDIFSVKGARIYTNLSNLVSGGERQADNLYSNNTVAIGATSPIFNNRWKVSAFYGNANQESVSFDGLINETNYLGASTNPEFDNSDYSHLDSTAKADYTENTTLLNIGRIMGKGTEIAFTYKRVGHTTKGEFEDSMYYLDETLDPPNINELYYGAENGTHDNSTPITTYALSYSKPYRNWTLRGDVFLTSTTENSKEEMEGFYFEDLLPGSPNTTFTTRDSISMLDQYDYTGNIAGVALRLSDENAYGVLWEIGGNFGMIFGSGDANEDLRYHIINQSENFDDEIAVFDSLYTNDWTAPLSVSGNAMGLNGRMEWQIDENVRFGLGCMLNSFSATIEEDRSYRLDIVSSYDNDDGTSDATDYDLTVNGYDEDVTYTEKISANRIAIPAGIELNFGKNKDWYMRIGALAVGSKNESSQEINVDTVSVYHRLIVDGNGDEFESYGTNVTYEERKVTSSATSQNVYYSYGLGWKPSPNLSLDLLGMFDATNVELLSTDWIRSLKLSATINIY